MPQIQFITANRVDSTFREDVNVALIKLYMNDDKPLYFYVKGKRVRWDKYLKIIGRELFPKEERDEPADSGKNTAVRKNSSDTVMDSVEKIERRDIAEKDDYTNGRLHVWKDALYLIGRYPVFGMSPGNRAAIANAKEMDLCAEIMRGDSLLSGYLELLTGSGIVGFALYMLFLGLCVRKLLRYDQKYNRYRLELGCSLGIITAMLAFSATTIDLFFAKTITTYLFWIVLGFAMALLRIGEREEHEADKSTAFICDTPVQVMNAVDLVLSDSELQGKSDIYLYRQFAGSDTLSVQLKEEKVFRHVYGFSPLPVWEGRKNMLLTLLRLMFPGAALKKIAEEEQKSFLNNRYDELYLSFYTPFTDLFYKKFRPFRVFQFEDGIGSYVTDDLETRYRSKTYEWFNRYLLSGALSYSPRALYLNTPDFGSKSPLPAHKIRNAADDDAFGEKLKRIFGFRDNALYRDHKVVYLSQPLGERAEGKDAAAWEKEVLEILRASDPAVRVHPRQQAEAFGGFAVDTVQNLWELECAEHITKEHVLVGAFSTAQFVPKMLYGREPVLVFLYKLYGCRFDGADEMLEKLRSAYSHRDRILVPASLAEIKELTERIKDRTDEQ